MILVRQFYLSANEALEQRIAGRINGSDLSKLDNSRGLCVLELRAALVVGGCGTRGSAARNLYDVH